MDLERPRALGIQVDMSMPPDHREGWKRIEAWLQDYRRRYSPAAWIHQRTGFDTGYYLTSVFVWLHLSIFVTACFRHTPGVRWWLWPLCAVLASLYVIDAVLANTSFAFFKGAPQSALRAVLLAVLAFWNVALAFAVFYVLAVEQPLTYGQALYFSVATVTTIGDSTVHVSGISRALVVTQMITSFYFVAVLLSIFVSWAGDDLS